MMNYIKWLKHARPLSGWLVVVPSILIVALILIFTPTTRADTVAPARLTGVIPQTAKPVCESCHPEEYAAWKNTPHAVGAGASCESCHGPYKEGHPDKSTMQLPMASETCKTCHAATFTEWQASLHAGKNIECFDCHNAHTQGLRTGSEEKLCAACHSGRQTQVAHATHGINGVNCADCHMAPESNATTAGSAKPVQGAVRSHSFKVASDVCAKCHESTIHTSNIVASLKTANVTNNQQQAGASPQLAAQVTSLQARIDSMRNASAVTMGLALGLGGFAGLIIGIAGTVLLQRRNS